MPSGWILAGLVVAGLAITALAVWHQKAGLFFTLFTLYKFPLAFSKRLIESSQDLIFVISANGLILFINAAFETATGWPRKAWVAKHFESLVHSEDLPLIRQWLQQLSRGETAPPGKLRIKSKSGVLLWLEFNISQLKQGNKIFGFLGTARDETRRLAIEENLRANERFLNSIFDNIQDGISVLDTELNILRVNRAMERWYPHEVPLLGKKCFQAYHQRNCPCTVCPSLDTLRTGKKSFAVVPLTGPRGASTGSLELYTFPLMDPATDTLVGVIEFVRDISGQVRAAEALRESRQTAENIMQSIPSGLLVYQFQAPDALILQEANPEAERLLRIQKHKYVGKEFDVLWPQAKASGLKDAFLKVMESGQPFFEEDFHYADERLTGDFLFRAFSMPGRQLGLAFENITEKKQAEQAWLDAETKFRSLVEHSLVGIFIAQDWKIQYANPKFLEIFGDSISRMTALPLVAEIVAPPDQERILKLVQEFAQNPAESLHFTFQGVRRDGKLMVCEVHGTATELNGRQVFIGTLLDITESKGLEEQLRQAQKMEAVGRLAGGVAHDFNNLLMAIMGFSELLLNRPGLEPRMIQDIEEIIKAGQRGGALTRQLLAYSRRQMLQIRRLDLNSVILNMQKMLSHLLGEDIELVLQLDPDLWTVKGDPVNLEQVIMNLSVNARDAMPEGGRLMFQTSNVTLQESDRQGMPDSRSRNVCQHVHPGYGVRHRHRNAAQHF